MGCPRSGTTILGHLLAQQPGFLYLNEPRHIWCQVKPDLDVYGWRYPLKDGVLCLDGADLDPRETRRLSQWFHLLMFTSLCHRVVEKTPRHVFRMRWLNAMFLDAQFIHVIRHGRDVALSFQEAVRGWWPPGYWESSRVYGLFRDYAAQHPHLRGKLGYVTESMNNYPRALLAWVCAVTEGRQAGSELGPQKYLEVRYEELICNPGDELGRIFRFISEPLDHSVVAYAREELHRHSAGKADPSPDLTRDIAGDLLRELDYGL